MFLSHSLIKLHLFTKALVKVYKVRIDAKITNKFNSKYTIVFCHNKLPLYSTCKKWILINYLSKLHDVSPGIPLLNFVFPRYILLQHLGINQTRGTYFTALIDNFAHIFCTERFYCLKMMP